MRMVLYFICTYAITWTCWLTALAWTRRDTGPTSSVLFQALTILGAITPSLVAMTFVWRARGQEGVRALLRPITRANVPVRWYVFALCYTAAIKLTAAVLHRAITGQWPAFGTTPWYVMAGAILFSTWVHAGEEVGWRGYALPRMASRMGLGAASILLGILWASWHLPLFFMPGADTAGQSFPLYLLQVTALSITFAWLYARTQSLLLVMFMHAAVNNTKDIVPSMVEGATDPFTFSTSLVARISLVLLWIGAGYFLVRMRGLKLAVT